MAKDGCTYGKVNRQMIRDIKSDVSEIKENIKMLTNHYSSRLPYWAVIIGSLLSSMIGVFATLAIRG